MLLYIHGFASSGFGFKARQLKSACAEKGLPVATPSLPVSPELALDTLTQWIELAGVSGIVGSSLGGFYAALLSSRHGLPAVLINPAMNPGELLKPAVNGELKHYYDQAPVSFTPGYLTALQTLQHEPLKTDRCLVLVQQGDEVISLPAARSCLTDAIWIEEPGGSHSFEGFERYFDRVFEHLDVGLPGSCDKL